MQQDLEDKKNKIIIEGLEKKIKHHEATLEKKDFVLQTMEGSLVEAQAEIARLNSELSMEKKNFEAKLEAEAVPAAAEEGFQLGWSQHCEIQSFG